MILPVGGFLAEFVHHKSTNLLNDSLFGLWAK